MSTCERCQQLETENAELRARVEEFVRDHDLFECKCLACAEFRAAPAEPDGGAGLMMAVVEAAVDYWEKHRHGSYGYVPLMVAVAAYKGEGGA